LPVSEELFPVEPVLELESDFVPVPVIPVEPLEPVPEPDKPDDDPSTPDPPVPASSLSFFLPPRSAVPRSLGPAPPVPRTVSELGAPEEVVLPVLVVVPFSSHAKNPGTPSATIAAIRNFFEMPWDIVHSVLNGSFKSWSFQLEVAKGERPASASAAALGPAERDDVKLDRPGGSCLQ
jgi:hypothetical protein